jgi:hypothetical protein
MSTAALPPETVTSALGGHISRTVKSPGAGCSPLGQLAALIQQRVRHVYRWRVRLQSVTLDPARGRRDASVGRHQPEVGTSGTRVTLTVLTPS